MRFSTDHRGDLLTEALRYHHLFSEKTFTPKVNVIKSIFNPVTVIFCYLLRNKIIFFVFSHQHKILFCFTLPAASYFLPSTFASAADHMILFMYKVLVLIGSAVYLFIVDNQILYKMVKTSSKLHQFYTIQKFLKTFFGLHIFVIFYNQSVLYKFSCTIFICFMIYLYVYIQMQFGI